MSTITIKDLIVQKKSPNGEFKSIIKNISTEFESGKINVIMGPNGCGKSTFLDALFGKSDKFTNISGEILVDGEVRELKTWLESVSYVEQESYLFQGQTVRECLNFAVSLCNIKNTTNYSINDFSEIFENLYLNKVIDSEIAKISGGERQRVHLAYEIIMDKKFLFFDEPTSDLDSHLALYLILYLKKFCEEKDKLIVLTIHQPSDQIFKLFTKLLFIKDGIPIYDGNAQDLQTYFASFGITKPDNWQMLDFIFEAFYEKSIYPEIKVQEVQISQFLAIKLQNHPSVHPNYQNNIISKKLIQFNFNFSHFKALLVRNFNVSIRKRVFYITPAIYIIIFVLLILFIYPKIKELFVDHIQASVAFNFENKKDKILNDSYIYSGILLSTYAFYTFLTVNLSGSDFSLIPQIAKEVSKGFYSSTSVFFSYFVFEIFYSMIIPLLTSIYLIVMRHSEILFFKDWVFIYASFILITISSLLIRIVFDFILKDFKPAAILKSFCMLMCFFSSLSIDLCFNMFKGSFVGSILAPINIISVVLFPIYFFQLYIDSTKFNDYISFLKNINATPFLEFATKTELILQNRKGIISAMDYPDYWLIVAFVSIPTLLLLLTNVFYNVYFNSSYSLKRLNK